MAQAIEGILCRKDRKFYWLETGPAPRTNTIDRLRSVLLRRNLISYHRTDPNDRGPTYKIMTLEEAKEKNLDIVVIYLNKHVEATIKAQGTAKTTNPWKS